MLKLIMESAEKNVINVRAVQKWSNIKIINVHEVENPQMKIISKVE